MMGCKQLRGVTLHLYHLSGKAFRSISCNNFHRMKYETNMRLMEVVQEAAQLKRH